MMYYQHSFNPSIQTKMGNNLNTQKRNSFDTDQSTDLNKNSAASKLPRSRSVPNIAVSDLKNPHPNSQRANPIENYHKYDDCKKSELINYTKTKKLKKINVDKSFPDHTKNINLECTNLLPLCIEFYEKSVLVVPDYDPTLIATQSFSSKRFCYVKPEFGPDKVKPTKLDLNNIKPSFNSELNSIVIPEPKITMKTTKFTQEEYNEAFRDPGHNKDMFGISKRMLFSASNFHKQRFINIYNKLYKLESSVADISVAKTSYIYKEAKAGPKNEIKSFRPIVAIPNGVNHLHRILSLRLNRYLDDNKYIDTTIQKAAVSGIKNGILEHVFKLKQVIKDANSRNKSLVVLFLDVSDAFGSIRLDHLYLIMKKYKIDDSFINYLKAYYSNFEYYAQTKDWSTELFSWNDGLVQGCPMSPLLFVLALNYVLSYLDGKFKETHGYNLGANQVKQPIQAQDQPIKSDDNPEAPEPKDDLKAPEPNKLTVDNKIMFAAFMDDIACTFNSVKSALEVYTKLKTLLENIGLKLNPSKSALLVINCTDEDKKIKLDEVPYVETYKYLGEYVSIDGTSATSYSAFISMLTKKLFALEKKKIDKPTKLKFFSKCMLPWIKRKMAIMYDIKKGSKLKIITLIKKYLIKWGSEEDIQIFTFIADTLSDSADEVVQKIDFDEADSDDEFIDDSELINSSFKITSGGSLGLTYDNINKTPHINKDKPSKESDDKADAEPPDESNDKAASEPPDESEAKAADESDDKAAVEPPDESDDKAAVDPSETI